MKIGRSFLFAYGTIISAVVCLGAAIQVIQEGNPTFFVLTLPIPAYFALKIHSPHKGHKILLLYGFIVTNIMAISGFLGASTWQETVSALIFLPLALYFWLHAVPKRNKALKLEKVDLIDLTLPETNQEEPKGQKSAKNEAIDVDRRTFIKLVGAIGLGVFLLSIFNRKVENALVGKIEKNSDQKSKVQANDLELANSPKLPTESYQISEIDDSIPTYLGFVDPVGKWFIMQESETGSFRYVKGESNFPKQWKNRANLNFDLYNNVF